LFTFHNTPCNTHDLLDCPCTGNGVVVDKDLLSVDPTDNDDEEEPGFLPASQYKPDVKKAKFDALHEFWHFDPQGWKERDDDEEFLCDVITDDVLRGVVERQFSRGGDGVAYLFGMKTG
jgi:hypothetical protein